MELIMDVELFDDMDEIELIEFGVPRRLYTRADHYNNMPDYTFFRKFRLTKPTVMFILGLIQHQLEFPFEINECVSPMNQLLTCLRYFATGAHLDAVADFMGVHQTTAVRIIPKVSSAIASLYRRFIKMPREGEEQITVKENFFQIARFPNVIGALDCTHIKIKSPGGEDPEIFRNRKDYFSINVQAICDANNKFLDVVARWPGASHDSTIFNNSNIKALFEEENLYNNCILLGDGGYPLKTYLLTPVQNANTPAQQLYNQSQIRTRNKIECTFGIWKRRFPVLAYGCRLKINTLLTVIVATAVLHNIAKENNEGEPGIDDGLDAGELEQLIQNGQIPHMGVENVDNRRDNRFSYRDQLINEYFSRL